MEIPLCVDDSCRLLAINLFGYVINPFTKHSYFDWESFKKDTYIAERIMDDIVDLELEKINKIIDKINSDPEDEIIKLYEKNIWERIKEKAILGRRTGLGITAEGDMLAGLGFTYGTDEATNFSIQVHKQLKLSAYRSSVDMAKERGAFPIYDYKKELNNPFIKRIQNEDPQLYEDMLKYGRRNIALLTIAPTGTVSLMTQTTSGIENCFLPVYMRRRKVNSQEKNVRIDFTDDEGTAWTEYPVFHHKFKMWLEVNDYDIDTISSMNKEQLDEIIKKSPYFKATSKDVNWIKKVEMQGKIQLEVDHSISVTINVPEETTEDIVANIYETGWKFGCKGITIYREGSRTGVLVGNKNENKDQKLFEENNAPKRPKRLRAEIYKFQNNLEKWVAIVGLLNDRPYEIFTGEISNGLVNFPLTSSKEYYVVKNIIEDSNGEKKKRYDIEYIDNEGNKQTYIGINRAFNPEYWNYAKLISSMLRHYLPLVKVYELISSLSFKEDHINTWRNGVARVIKRYIKDGEKSKGSCPNCGGEDFEFKEGCLMCSSCGYSRCN